MAPVKDAPSESLSACISTESYISSKTSTAASVSTAAFLHNASVKSRRNPPNILTYDQICSTTRGESDIDQCEKILSTFRQEDVVYALMTHLKEREGDLKRITEQRNLSLKLKMASDTTNQQLQGALSIQKNLLQAKESTIKSLENKLEESEALKGGEEKIKELTHEIASLNEEREKVKDAYHKVLTDKEDTITDLKDQVQELSDKLAKCEKKKSSRHSKPYEEQINELESKLEESENENSQLKSELEEMDKAIKRKAWMIDSMKQENEDQRHREDNLHTHIKGMQQIIGTYESKFIGKGVDVPMVLAKLVDAETRSKDLADTMCQMEIQMSVMRMEFRKHGLDLEKIEMDFPVASIGNDGQDRLSSDDERRQPPSMDEMSVNDTATIDSILEPYDPFGNGQDDISLLKQDVKKGFDNMIDAGLCRYACGAEGIEMEDETDLSLGIDAVYTDATDTDVED